MLQNPDPSSKTAIRIKLHTKVHLRPYRSAKTPKSRAPRDRKRSVRVMAVVMCFSSAIMVCHAAVTHLGIGIKLLCESLDSEGDGKKVVPVTCPGKPPREEHQPSHRSYHPDQLERVLCHFRFTRWRMVRSGYDGRDKRSVPSIGVPCCELSFDRPWWMGRALVDCVCVDGVSVGRHGARVG